MLFSFGRQCFGTLASALIISSGVAAADFPWKSETSFAFRLHQYLPQMEHTLLITMPVCLLALALGRWLLRSRKLI
jgi:hypothetical protein